MEATREAIDAAHAAAVENGEATVEDVRQVPGQQDFEGAVIGSDGAAYKEGSEPERRQKDGGEFVESFPEEIRVDGTTQLSAFDLGGKRPSAATMTLSGTVVFEAGTAMSKGEVFEFSGTGVVRGTAQKDAVDKKT